MHPHPGRRQGGKPMSGTGHLHELLDLEELTGLLHDFAAATGLTYGLFDQAGRPLVAPGGVDIDREFHRAVPESRALSAASDQAPLA